VLEEFSFHLCSIFSTQLTTARLAEGIRYGALLVGSSREEEGEVALLPLV